MGGHACQQPQQQQPPAPAPRILHPVTLLSLWGLSGGGGAVVVRGFRKCQGMMEWSFLILVSLTWGSWQ